MNAIARVLSDLTQPSDPAELGYPPTLPIEVALRDSTIPEICESYGITREQWNQLRLQPRFVEDVSAAVELLRTEGMSFKMKARLQSEELLKKSWQMIHDKTGNVPPAVQADLLKFTIKSAGLSEEKNVNVGQQNALSININLG